MLTVVTRLIRKRSLSSAWLSEPGAGATPRRDRRCRGVVEPHIERTFGVLVAEDDFSPAGAIEYRPAVDGHLTDFDEVIRAIEASQNLLARFSASTWSRSPTRPSVASSGSVPATIWSPRSWLTPDLCSMITRQPSPRNSDIRPA
jgi:hypothetical protein